MRSLPPLLAALALLLAACGGPPAAPAAPTAAGGAPPAASPAPAGVAPATSPGAAVASPAATPAAVASPAGAASPAAASSPAAATSPVPAAASSAAAVPATPPGLRLGGTLVVATNNDPGQLNPAVTTAGGTHLVADLMFNGLVELDEGLNPTPDLAESWTVSPDGREYTFKLRSGVVWHDGQPFSSADVKYTFEEALLKFHSRTKAGLEDVLAGIDTPDAATVVFRFKAPYGPLLQRLDVIEAPIIPKHIYMGSDPSKSDANLRPIGTGPFKFVDYAKGDRVTLARHERYFKPGLPRLDEVVFRIIPQATTATLALEQGEVDYLWSIPGAELARLRSNPAITIAQTGAGPGGSFCIDTLIPNLRRPPLDKLEVRQALDLTIDRQALLQQVYFGQGRVATGPIASTVAWAYKPAPPTQRDLTRARALLDAAGYPAGTDGKRLGLTFVHASQYARQGEALRAQLAEVGIDLELRTLDFNAAVEQVFVRNEFDLGFASYCNGPDPEIGVRRVYVSTNIKPIPFSNGAAYRNTRVDELFDRAAATVDREARARDYGEIQDIIRQEVPYLALIETEGARAFRREFRDFAVWSGHFAEPAWWEKGPRAAE